MGVQLSKQKEDDKIRTNKSGLKIREGISQVKVKGKAHALSSTQKC